MGACGRVVAGEVEVFERGTVLPTNLLLNLYFYYEVPCTLAFFISSTKARKKRWMKNADNSVFVLACTV